MYFVLYKHCVLNKNVIYDLLHSQQYLIEKGLLEILQLFIKHEKTEVVVEKYGLESLKNFQEFFIGNKLGEFCDELQGRERISSFNDYIINLHDSLPFKLEQVVLEITGECNLNCDFCKSETITYRSCGCKKWKYDRFMDDEKYIELADEIIALRPDTVIFSGGEPLLKKELLVKLIEKFVKANISCKVYTNGELMDEYIFDKFIKNKVDIYWQMVSNVDDKYKILTKSNLSFKTIYDKMKKYINMGGNVVVLLLICKENEDNVSEMENFLKGNNLQYFKSFIYPPNQSVSTKYYEESISCKSKKNICVNMQNYDYLKRFSACLVDSIFISESGDVYPCMMLRKFELGSLFDKKLYQIFREDKYYKFWQLSKGNIQYCKDCGYNIICQDCRALEYQATGIINGMHYCEKLLGDENV